jgi:hypothetical protein
MIGKLEKGYIKEIEGVEWLAEVISERFDNALGLMSHQSVIYGGAVRDTIAEKELLGDLDIAVTPEAFAEMAIKFQENPRWVVHDPSRSGPIVGKSRNSGDMARELAPMSNVSSFINMNGMVAQLITSNDQNKDRVQAAIYPARQVDIVCCGVVMLCDGRVFEVLPGAFDDCKSGILRINDASETIYLDTLKSRVEKFISRGWENTIDVEKVIKEVTIRRNRQKKLRRNSAPPEGMTNIDEIEQHVFINDPEAGPPTSGHMQEIRQAEKYGAPDRLIMIIKKLSRIHCYNVRVVTSPLGQVYIECQDGHKAGVIIRDLMNYKEKKKRKVPYPSAGLPKGAGMPKGSLGGVSDNNIKGFKTGGTVTGRIRSRPSTAPHHITDAEIVDQAKQYISQPHTTEAKSLPMTDPAPFGGHVEPDPEPEVATESPDLLYEGSEEFETIPVPSHQQVEIEFRSNDGETLTKMKMSAGEAEKLKNGWESLNDLDKANILNKLIEPPVPPPKMKFKKSKGGRD